MRLFLAIELPDSVHDFLKQVRNSFSVQEREANGLVSWVRAENWHITLKFLGEVEPSRITALTSALEMVRIESIDLFGGHIQYFPTRGPVNVISIGLGGDIGRLNELHEQIELRCKNIGFPTEGRAYTGHITIGRTKKIAAHSTTKRLRQIKFSELFPGPKFTVQSFVLMQSELDARGSRYTTLARFPLFKS